VTPIVTGGRLFLFMELTSPKGHDIVQRGVYALHCLVADANGTGGEFYVRGRGEQIDNPQPTATAARAASYTPQDRYVLRAAHRRGAMQRLWRPRAPRATVEPTGPHLAGVGR
jgi:hypothetical protein